MPRGFGRGFGAGWAYGPYGGSFSYGGYPLPYGRGRGNPFPFCRSFPWLPRRWWLHHPYATMPYAGYYTPTAPYLPGYTAPYFLPGYAPPYGSPQYGAGYSGIAPPGLSTEWS